MRRKSMHVTASKFLVVGAMVLIGAGTARALTIERNFIAPGQTFPEYGGTAGEAPGNLAGTGKLTDLVDAAANWWEWAIGDVHTVRVDFGWNSLGGFTLAVATQWIVPQPPEVGQVEFDNDGSSVFFMDPTPYDNSEFASFSESFDDLGGGYVNTGRVYGGPAPIAAGAVDLLTVAMHEIGHLMGVNGIDPGPIRIRSPLPYAGTRIPMTSDGHIRIDTTLMAATIASGVRKLGSWVDILGAAQNSGWSDVDLSPVFFVPGDLSSDRFVGQRDLDIVLDAWGQTGPFADGRGDATGDGLVGQSDLDVVLEHWGQAPGPAAGGQAAPEPGAAALVGLGSFLLVLRRRK